MSTPIQALLNRYAQNKQAALSAVDLRVVVAFVNHSSADGRLLFTDGKTLEKMGLGGSKFAVWRGSVIALVRPPMVKSDDVILRALAKVAGKERVSLLWEQKGYAPPLRMETGGDSFFRDQYDGYIEAFMPGIDRPVGRLDWNSYQGGAYQIKMVNVVPEWQRTGIATEMYKKLFHDLNITAKDLKPAYQTPEGHAFRQRALLANLQGVVEVPKNTHPVEVQPPKAKRKKFPFTGYIDFQGLEIDIENKKGDTREGENPDGTSWQTYMNHHYGEIRKTEGSDGDKLDCYVGDNHDSSLVVVIHQHDPDTGKFDEDKVMLGFDSVEEAIGAYKKQYDQPGFYKEDDYLEMPIGQFWRWVHEDENRGKKVKDASVKEPRQMTLQEFWQTGLKRTLKHRDASFEQWLRQRGVSPHEIPTESEDANFIGGTLFRSLNNMSGMERGRLRGLAKKVERRNEFLEEYHQEVGTHATYRDLDPDPDLGADAAAARSQHKRTIMKALAQRLPVPPEVLAAYPEINWSQRVAGRWLHRIANQKKQIAE